MKVYRDGDDAARHRANEIRAEIEQLRARIRPRLLELLDERTRNELQALEQAAEEDIAETNWREAVNSLTAYRQGLSDLVSRAPELAYDYYYLSSEVHLDTLLPRIQPGRWQTKSVERPSQKLVDGRRAMDALSEQLKRLDAGAHIKTTGGRRSILLAELNVRRTPLCVQLTLSTAGSWFIRAALLPALAPIPYLIPFLAAVGKEQHWITVATSIADSTPTLRMVPTTFSGDLLASMKLRKSIEFGDIELDGLFATAGDKSLTKRLLRKKTKTDLLALTKIDIPKLEVEDGFAHITWRYDGQPGALRRAIRILSTIRKYRPRVRLLDD